MKTKRRQSNWKKRASAQAIRKARKGTDHQAKRSEKRRYAKYRSMTGADDPTGRKKKKRVIRPLL
jgi:hypothetical protein|tara:strand:+ start:299 stop:493 length:195 start_codon:yes stop_codon:yes gene_type:complete